jgi:signal transduction histidine kinase
VRRNVTPPKVVISQVVVDDRRLAPAAVGRLGPGPRTLEFHYAGLSLVQPHRVAHRHRLEGFDPDWVEAGARRVAHYNNLGPGRYRFRVTASNNDGVWNETGASVAFEIAPHPFQTAWFYALCGAAAVALALGLHTLRLRQIRARYQAVLTERRRVARELHDSVLQAVASIGWQLTAVKKRVPASAGDAHRQLDVAQDLVARSLDETRWYIVGLRTAEAGEDDLALALTQMARRVTLGSPLRCEVLVGGQPRALASAVERELYRIAQEALTNAARHAGARRVDMRLHYGDASLRLSISDDGRGFEAADGPAAGHFGSVGMRERAEQIGGRFSLRSAPGAGTTIEVTVPAAVSTTEKAHG